MQVPLLMQRLRMLIGIISCRSGHWSAPVGLMCLAVLLLSSVFWAQKPSPLASSSESECTLAYATYAGRLREQRSTLEYTGADQEGSADKVFGSIAPLKKSGASFGADLDVLTQETRRLWYHAQKVVAQWMGDTRVKRIGTYLITSEQQEQMDRSMLPGDIIIVRKNWYLSNVGLPGFWSHAALYLGEPDKFKAYFDAPEVRTYLSTITGKETTLDQYLLTRWPREWERYTRGESDDPYRVMEAISEGVVFNNLGHVAGDYAAALRPRLDKLAKTQAIIEAFHQLGKPYDFDFDFATEHALVCTELIWRSYRPALGKAGLDLPLVVIMGRKTLPANELVRFYAEKRKSPDAQLDFIFFIDAIEEQQIATMSTEEEFARTYLRTKWDIALP